MEKWHVYCDEAGEFENIEQHFKYKNSILAAMLVQEENIRESADVYIELCRKHKISDTAVHGKDVYKEPWYIAFSEELVDLTVKLIDNSDSPIRLCRSTFKDDLYNDVGHISETFACNRYLYMMESLLEHLIFLDTRSYEKDQMFAILPNSRVFPCNQEQNVIFQKNGFETFRPESKTRPNFYLAKVWDETGLRIFLNRLQTDYSPFASIQGKRSIDRIELPFAKESKDPFVHWIDNLAGVLMWTSGESKAKLENALYMDISYGEITDLFKRLCLLYLSGKYNEFVEHYFSAVNKINNRHYTESLNILIDKSLEKFGECSIKQAQHLESLVNNHLRSSTGAWQFVSMIIDYLIKALKNTKTLKNGDTVSERLLFRLYNHKLSFHNHRGEIVAANEVIRESDNLAFKPATIQEWREHVDFTNRKSVNLANLFDFKACNPELESIIDALSQSRETLNRLGNISLSDPLIGRLSGTIAQNYAFLAPFDISCFHKAETLFIKAREEFEKPADILRQNIYLAHLYMDRGITEKDKLAAVIKSISSDSSVKAFIDAPSRHNSKYMSFSLAVLLKYFLNQQIQPNDFLKTFTKNNIKTWFEDASDEHPFELIFAYLGRLSYQAGDDKPAEDFFNSTLHIPAYGKTADQITIRMIHAQIMVLWAIEYAKRKETDKAVKKLKLAMSIMTKIGDNIDYSSILSIENGKGISGWFADGYNALIHSFNNNQGDNSKQAVSIDLDACHKFLKCFTFNYC